MSNYCVISFININNIPYANKYIGALSKGNDFCDVIYWDRYGNDIEHEESNVKYIPYNYTITHKTGRIHKYVKYIGVIQFIRKKLKEKSYAGVVLLQTHAAVACADILILRYCKQYIVDIRDYTLENFRLYYLIENIIIKRSYAAVISSPAYKNFLPPYQYVIAHNYTQLPQKILRQAVESQQKYINEKIVISFIGTVRFYDMDITLINLFANDDRFILEYIGSGALGLKAHCETRNINNVRLIDSFPQEMTFEFYTNVHFINNLYGYGDKYLDLALSNRLYHAAQLGIPILVCKNTYMAEIIQKYRLGFIFDFNDPEIKEQLLNYYHNIDFNILRSNGAKFIHEVTKENTAYDKLIHKFIRHCYKYNCNNKKIS